MTACIDIGGSDTRVGVSRDGSSFDDIKIFPTEEMFDEELKKITEILSQYASELQKVVIAAAGVVDRKNGTLIRWGQRRSWQGKNYFDPIRKISPSADYVLENDADAAGLAEAVSGAGKAYSIVAYLTLSSGIGGNLIVNGKVQPQKYGIEPGHQIINFNETEEWTCGQRGCFESYASGFAFEKRFGVKPDDCMDPEIWKKYAALLAVGLVNVMAMWSPEVIVLGGGVSNKFDMFIEPLKQEITSRISYEQPEIVAAEFDEPGLHGGLVLASS